MNQERNLLPSKASMKEVGKNVLRVGIIALGLLGFATAGYFAKKSDYSEYEERLRKVSQYQQQLATEPILKSSLTSKESPTSSDEEGGGYIIINQSLLNPLTNPLMNVPK